MGLATTSVFKQLQNNNKNLTKMSNDQLKKLQSVLLEMVVDFDNVCRKYKLNYHLGGGSCLGAIRHDGFIPWDDDIDVDIVREDYDTLEKIFKKELGGKYYLESINVLKDYDLNVPKIRKKGTIYRTKDDLGRDRAGIGMDLCIIENTYNFAPMRYLHGFLSLSFGFIFSCRNFFTNRKVYMEMAGDNKSARRVFRLKIIIGFFFAWRSGRNWAKAWNRVNRMCKNNKSRFVTVPVGRNHFFGEMYERRDFCKTVEHSFEGKKLFVPIAYDKYLKHMYGDYMVMPPDGKKETHAFFELDFGDNKGSK